MSNEKAQAEGFRPVRRQKREISLEMARELLKECKRGVLAVNGDGGYPYAIPMNYFYDEEENKIYFHGARAGHKYDSIKACDKVCFTVYGRESMKEDDWAPFVQSTVVFGRCHMITNQSLAIELVRKLAMKYYPNETLVEEEIAESGKAVQLFEIEIEHLSGKEIHEK